MQLISKKFLSEIGDETITHFSSGLIADLSSSDEETDYLVLGFVYQDETNTTLNFEKRFEKKEDAETYLKEMAKIYPKSEIILTKETRKEILIYV